MGRPWAAGWLIALLPGIAPWALRPCAAASAPRLLLATSSSWNKCYAGQQPNVTRLPAWSGNPADFFDDYRQLKDIDRFIDNLQGRRPDLVTVREIGTSWQGRKLRLLEITNSTAAKAEDKPCLFLEGGIHAREWIASATILFIADLLVREAESPAVAAALQEFVFSIMAPVNPDGYVYSWENDRMWRKTRSDRPGFGCQRLRDGVAGVDANRNWGYTWGETKDSFYGSQLRDPCTEVFIGPEAFSEPEVRAVADYMTKRQERSVQRSTRDATGRLVPGPGHVAAFLDFHSYAQVLLPPWAYTAETPVAPDGDYQTGLTGAMLAAIKNASGRSFTAGADAFPADPGTGPDWAYGHLGVRATMTIELEGNSSTSFCLPRDLIRDVGAEQWQAVQAIIKHLRAHGSAPSSLIGLFSPSPGTLPTRLYDIRGGGSGGGPGWAWSAVPVAAMLLAFLGFLLHRCGPLPLPGLGHPKGPEFRRFSKGAGDFSPRGQAVQLGRV